MTNLLNTWFPNVSSLGWTGDSGWGTAIWQTVYMTLWPAVFGGVIGLIFGVLLVVTKPGGILENSILFSICDKIVSVFRAIPFIILLAFIAPFTQLLVGTNWDDGGISAIVRWGSAILCAANSSGLRKC